MKNTNTLWDNEKIRVARQAIGFKAMDAAQLLQITGSYLSQIETGVLSPSSSLIARMSQVYQQRPAFFLKDEKEDTNNVNSNNNE